jgi:hypothetical protein
MISEVKAKYGVKVYFETENGSYAENVAWFSDENLYMKCFKALQKEAKKDQYIIIESIIEEAV